MDAFGVLDPGFLCRKRILLASGGHLAHQLIEQIRISRRPQRTRFRGFLLHRRKDRPVSMAHIDKALPRFVIPGSRYKSHGWQSSYVKALTGSVT
jgi:hypothetical protein